MKMFTYFRAVSETDIPAGAVLLAGGQSLLPDMKARTASPDTLVDIKALLPIGIQLESDRIVIGAGTTHADIAADPILRDTLPGLAALAGDVGDPSVRNRGTLGGALVADHPAGDWPAAALALDAVLTTTQRQISFAEFRRETGRDPSEIVRQNSFTSADDLTYVKFLHPAQRYAIVGVLVARTGAAERAVVSGLWQGGARFWKEADRPATDDPTLRGDPFASADFRIELAAELHQRAMAQLDGADRVVSIVHGQGQ